MLAAFRPGILQFVLAVPILIWAIVSIIMVLEDENKGKRSTTSAEWMKKYAPKWYKWVFCLLVLPLIVAILICHHFGF